MNSKISFRAYLQNLRHSFRLWLYGLTCNHNWLFQVGWDGMPDFWHCTKCGKLRKYHGEYRQ